MLRHGAARLRFALSLCIGSTAWDRVVEVRQEEKDLLFLGEAFREFREQRGLSAGKLAAATGIDGLWIVALEEVPQPRLRAAAHARREHRCSSLRVLPARRSARSS